MIKEWLARKIGLPDLGERVAVLERALGEQSALIAVQGDRAAVAEAHALAASTALERMGRQVRFVTRATRVGAARLKGLLATDHNDQSARVEALDKEIGRLKAALAVLESRLDAEAEQAQRGMTGLLQRIEATRPRRDFNRTRAGEPPAL
jgi:hypothetical protein